MDIIGLMNAINRYGKYFVVLIVLANLISISFADANTATTQLEQALETLCTTATTFLAGSIVVLIVLSAVVYAIGQIMGAETRARASVWATAMLTGAVIAAIIYILTPMILNVLLSGSGVTVNPNNPCDFQGQGGG